MDSQALICVGALILIIAVVIVSVLLNLKPYRCHKHTEGTNTCLSINAKRNLDKVTVVARFGNEEVNFERKRIRKGQNVQFVYPASKKPAKLIVEVESGNVQVAEV